MQQRAADAALDVPPAAACLPGHARMQQQQMQPEMQPQQQVGFLARAGELATVSQRC